MKRLSTAIAISCLLATPILAGGIAEPMMEPEVIAEETTNSGGFIVPLILLAAIAAIASSSGGSSGTAPCIKCS